MSNTSLEININIDINMPNTDAFEWGEEILATDPDSRTAYTIPILNLKITISRQEEDPPSSSAPSLLMPIIPTKSLSARIKECQLEPGYFRSFI
jgi:hypothetical protein